MKRGKEMGLEMYTLHLLACKTLYRGESYVVLMESVLN